MTCRSILNNPVKSVPILSLKKSWKHLHSSTFGIYCHAYNMQVKKDVKISACYFDVKMTYKIIPEKTNKILAKLLPWE